MTVFKCVNGEFISDLALDGEQNLDNEKNNTLSKNSTCADKTNAVHW